MFILGHCSKIFARAQRSQKSTICPPKVMLFPYSQQVLPYITTITFTRIRRRSCWFAFCTLWAVGIEADI